MHAGVIPVKLDLARDKGLAIEWSDGATSYFSIAYLRRMSPSADMIELRAQMQRNPLTVLPASATSGPLTALAAELVGNYALRIRFSDGHDTGIYSWQYLRSIDPNLNPRELPSPEVPSPEVPSPQAPASPMPETGGS